MKALKKQWPGRIVRALLMTALLLLSISLLFVCRPVLAEEAEDVTQRVFDFADKLSEEERAEFEERTAQIAKEYQQDILLVTTTDTGGKSTMDYADDFFDERMGRINADGGVIVLDLEHRQLYFSTSGRLIDILPDLYIQEIIDAGLPDLKAGDVAAMARKMFATTEGYLARGVQANQFREEGTYLDFDPNAPRPGTESAPRSRDLNPGKLGLGALGGLGSGGLFFMNKKKSYKSRFRPLHYSVAANGIVSMHQPEDELIDTRVKVIPIVKESSSDGGFSGSSGRSSTHVSSSGGTHGGGGASF